jgi:hypothetical protein
MTIRVIGPKDYSRFASHPFLVDVTAQSATVWSKGLAPEVLGPVPLYGGRVAQTMKNAWEFSKVYPVDLSESGQPTQQYWDWATEGWSSPTANAVERSKEGRPEFCYWDGKHLSALDARKKVFWSLYRNSVAKTAAFTHLKTMFERCPEVVLFDFDGFDEEARNLTLKDVLLDLRRPLSHAFILKAMLQHGDHVSPEDVLSNNAQISLF